MNSKELIEKTILKHFPSFIWPQENFTYKINGKEKILSLEEVLLGLEKRIPYTSSIEKAINHMAGYYFNPQRNFLTKPTERESSFYYDLHDFLKAMGRIKAHEGILDNDLDKVLKEYNYSLAFINWIKKEKNLSTQQIVCEHENSDTFSTDGQFYNSIGTCEKCGCEEEDFLDSQTLALLSEAFEAGRNYQEP